jgi:hypothetical protein
VTDVTDETEETEETEEIEEDPLLAKSSNTSSTIETVVAAVGAAIGAQAFVAKTYEERIANAMATLDTNRSKFLKLDGATETGSLRSYSLKLDHILRKLAESPGPNLVYSQFKTVEGLGVLGIALKANGYEELKLLTTSDERVYLSESSIKSLREKKMTVKRFITFSGDGTRAQKLNTLHIFNGRLKELPVDVRRAFQDAGFDVTGETKYLHGEICKVIGITGAGAEGISLRNVRQVHIMEPYWNMVRIEQVKGRAVRICSHMDLPVEERKVEIYTYVSRFSAEQLEAVGEGGIPGDIRMTDADTRTEGGRQISHIYTSDEGVFNVALRKEQITQSLLKLMKEVAVDCQINALDNEPDDLSCFVVPPPKPGANPKMFDPDLKVDLSEAASGKLPAVAAVAAAGAGAAAAGAGAEAGAGAGAGAEAVTEKREKFKIIKVTKKSTGEKLTYIMGEPDADGYVLLYKDTDQARAYPISKAQILADGRPRIVAL